MREGGKITGKPLKDADGKPLMQPGTLKGTKAIGWFIDEYGIAQVSMNITDTSATPLHKAFDEVAAKADARGIRVTGTEIVGLVPRKAPYRCRRVLPSQAAAFARHSRQRENTHRYQIYGARRTQALRCRRKIVEDVLAAREPHTPQLIDMSAKTFAETTASEAPAPGGGSVAAYMGALAAALATMVANLAAHKAGWDDRWEEFSDMAVRGQKHMKYPANTRRPRYRGFQRNYGRIRHAKSNRCRELLAAGLYTMPP